MPRVGRNQFSQNYPITQELWNDVTILKLLIFNTFKKSENSIKLRNEVKLAIQPSTALGSTVTVTFWLLVDTFPSVKNSSIFKIISVS